MNDELLTKYLLKETNKEEEEAVREWIDADPDHERQFRQLRLVWDASQQLAHQSDVDENEAWGRFAQRLEATPPKSTVGIRQPMPYLRWLRIAVVFVAMLFASLMGYYFLAPNGGQLLATHFRTGDGIRKEILPDGSTITLNKHSAMSYSSGPFQQKRTVKIRSGEAFFSVEPDERKPFVVQSGDVTITVLGTSFNVKRNGTQTEVVVESGLVKVGDDARKVQLRRGQKVVINTITGQFEEGVVNDQLHTYYVDNRFVLDNTPLWRMVEVLEEAYCTEIIVSREDLLNLPLTTTFHRDSLDNILKVVGETFGITVVKQDGKFILK